MRGRVYDPVAARFLSADPVANVATSQGMNPYSYVENSPTNYVDPSGFIPQLFAADEGLAFGVLGWAGIVGGATFATVAPGLSLGGGIAGTLGRLPGIGGAFASGPRTVSFGTPGTSAPASMAATGRAQYDATAQAKGGPTQAGSDLYNEVEPGDGTDERLAMLPRPDCQKSLNHPQCDPMFAADIMMLPSGAVLRGAKAAGVIVYKGGAWLLRKILPKAATMAGRRLGHTFSKHGADKTAQLLKEAAGSGRPVGQWLDNAKAERFIAKRLDQLKNGAQTFDLPKGMGRVVNPDGSFSPATKVRIVPSGNGVRTAYPFNP